MEGDLKSCLRTINNLALEEDLENVFEEATSAFRHLRNACAKGADVQNEIISDGNVLKSTQKIISAVLNYDRCSDEVCLCLALGLQFLANLIVANSATQALVWQSYRNEFERCLKFKNAKVQNCTAMIMYNIFLGHAEYMPQLSNAFEDVICLLTNEKSSEFPLYLVQLFVSKAPVHVKRLYETLKPDSKLLVLEAVHDLLRSNDEVLHEELVLFFVSKFLNYTDTILSFADVPESASEATETVKILELLSSVSGSETNLQVLQKQNSLLANCVALLKSVHSISKEPDNNFSMIQKLSELNEIERDGSVQEHPCFGFKSSLVRLVGNLCWECAENQKRVRELECIPVLLDCCNIDGRNPFIIQWAILAIRNICKDNEDNQKLVASMSRTGTIDVDKLRQMGILLNKGSDGSSVSIAPLELKK